MSTPIIIDCDPGHDDAMAILYAARHLNLIAITTVFGNSSLENTTKNALSICALGNLDIPIAMGMSQALVQQHSTAADIHGKSGIDGALLPQSNQKPISKHAVQLIIDEARANQENLILAPIGPLTNIAVALKTEPKLAHWLKGITLMGGSTTIGNISAMAEFNIYCDPEAASVVFASGVPITMAGLNITRLAGIEEVHVQRLRNSNGRVGQTFADLLSFYLKRSKDVFNLKAASMHDPCAIIPLIAPDLINYQSAHVHIELESPHLRGMTACDLRNINISKIKSVQKPMPHNARVAIGIDGTSAVNQVIDSLLSYDSQ